MTEEAGPGGEELSPTDAAILEMIREGRYDAEIASRLYITTADVKWLLGYLGRITDAQIMEALKASGATPEEVTCFTASLRDRINQLRQVAQ